MSNVQSMLSLGAMIMVSFTSLQFNSTLLQTSTVEVENKIYLTAFSLADDMLEEIKNKSFDTKTLQFPTTVTANLTASANLGPEVGETILTFNDIDDYKGYTKVVSAPHAENYTVSCDVFYVKENAPDETSSVQTFYKKAVISVTSPYLRNGIDLSFIYTLK